jgi:hypothetical protein
MHFARTFFDRRRNVAVISDLDLHALFAYNAGTMQYTLRHIPPDLDRALRKVARQQRKSLNQVAVDALRRGSGANEEKPMKRRDLADIAGTWKCDPEIDKALADQRRLDPEMWE